MLSAWFEANTHVLSGMFGALDVNADPNEPKTGPQRDHRHLVHGFGRADDPGVKNEERQNQQNRQATKETRRMVRIIVTDRG